MAPLFNGIDFNMIPGAQNLQPRALNSSVHFTPYERKGVIIMTVAGFTSCTFVSSLLLYIIFSAISLWLRPRPYVTSPFIKKQVAVFVICLLASDFIQSIAGILQMKWAIDGRIYDGAACTVQAATLLMGDLGSTVWSCVIAAHTFSGLALGKPWPRWLVYVTVILGWSFVLVLTVIGPAVFETTKDGPFYGIAGDWCFITTGYAIHRLLIHYVPLFIAAIIILVLYGLVFLVLNGTISFTTPRVDLSPFRMDDIFVRERVAIAKRMLWYPVAFLTCILPIAVVRLVGLNDANISQPIWIFSMFFLFMLGAVDSIIYATTRNVFKTTRVSVHLNTFSSDASTRRKSGMSDIDRLEMDGSSHRGLDMTQYVKVRWEKDGANGQKTTAQHEVQPGAVHVTLERIQEVM